MNNLLEIYENATYLKDYIEAEAFGRPVWIKHESSGDIIAYSPNISLKEIKHPSISFTIPSLKRSIEVDVLKIYKMEEDLYRIGVLRFKENLHLSEVELRITKDAFGKELIASEKFIFINTLSGKKEKVIKSYSCPISPEGLKMNKKDLYAAYMEDKFKELCYKEVVKWEERGYVVE